MTQDTMLRWKLKTDSSHTLLVLIALILVKAKWVEAQSPEDTNSIDDSSQQTQVFIGNDQIADYYFSSSSRNDSFILEGINKCLDNFQMITCMKMLLLSRINDVVSLLEESGARQKDLHLLNGILTLKIKNSTADSGLSETETNLSLDDEIAVKVRKMFKKRSLLVNLLPKTKIEIEPSPENSKDGFICFRYTIRQETVSAKEEEVEGRKRKSGGMPMMIIPPLIMMGLMPFTLASLKAMVMNAVMINMMALNGAIFMTIRNLVFGPRKGDNVKYVNYGYSKDRQTQSRRPVLIIHSPAAFVKQPPVHRHRRPSYHGHNHFQQQHFSSEAGSSSYQYNTNTIEDYDNQYYPTQQNDDFHSSYEREYSRRETVQQRPESQHLGDAQAASSQTSNQIFSPFKGDTLKRYQNNQKLPSAHAHLNYQSSNRNPQLQRTGSGL